MNFETFNFHTSVMAGVHALGYTIPTPIQLQAIPPILQGRDVIGLAQTGTGKTAAFVLPILERLRSGPRGGVRALIISPTRELAEQTCEVIDGLGCKTQLRGVTIYGGVSMTQQIRALHGKPEIVVACPGRLLDHLWKGTINLSGLEILVIDEADRMFDMGFLPDVRNILSCIMHKRQTLLFSATMPDNIRRLAREILHDPVTIQIDHTLPIKTVSHFLYPVQQHLKTTLLKEILNKTKTDSVLVFTRTKHRAERVTQQLVREGYRVTSLQGNLSQGQRQAALTGFRNGSIKILVATDIAARGIDVLSISHVINYDMPETTDDYVHRIGRTGRVEKNGDALTLVTGEDGDRIRAIERLLGAPLERLTLKGFDYNRRAPDREVSLSYRPRRPFIPRQGIRNQVAMT
ncbi:MAG: DEAD/DEAH box helicase [Dehalococcoidia bacterium]|nr:DEAD/DEAH box helicase [Dehalococcoidia bacterium]MDZ4246041.1 DEAD/DEAH box helicase [Dehalococcoidia bacterium]